MAIEQRSHWAVCGCGDTAIELIGAPIASVTCFCRSCRTAGEQFEEVAGAPPTLTVDGGVDYCLYRKDRVRLVRGAEHLEEHRLEVASPTRRVATRCCGSPMFLDFTPGHWLTVFRDRLAPSAPPAQLRIMTRDRPAGAAALSGALPSHSAHAPRLMLALFGAWAAMGFRRPKIVW